MDPRLTLSFELGLEVNTGGSVEKKNTELLYDPEYKNKVMSKYHILKTMKADGEKVFQ